MTNLDEQIENFVAEYYHRWVKYGYYGSPDKPLNEDTEYRQACDFIKALIANQVREARIKEAEYYLRNTAELSLKRTVGVNVIKDRIAALKGDDK